MTDAAAEPEEKPSRKKGLLVALLAALLFGGGGFATSYLGIWSPSALFSGGDSGAKGGLAAEVDFIAVPVVELNIGGSRSLVVAAMIETEARHRAGIEHLMPRVLDAFTSFLSGIEPAAYDKRGVLEIIRAELVTRTRLVLGDEPVRDVLITEFRIK